MSFGFCRSLEGGHELVSQLLGVPVTSPDVVLQPVGGFVRLLTKGTQRPRLGPRVLVSEVSGKVLLENDNTTHCAHPLASDARGCAHVGLRRG